MRPRNKEGMWLQRLRRKQYSFRVDEERVTFATRIGIRSDLEAKDPARLYIIGSFALQLRALIFIGSGSQARWNLETYRSVDARIPETAARI